MKKKIIFLRITNGRENIKEMIQKALNEIITTRDIVMNQRAFESLSPKPSNALQINFIKDVFDFLFDFESAVL